MCIAAKAVYHELAEGSVWGSRRVAGALVRTTTSPIFVVRGRSLIENLLGSSTREPIRGNLR